MISQIRKYYRISKSMPKVINQFGLIPTMKLLSGEIFPKKIKQTRVKDQEITVLTFSIHPDLARIWYHYALKNVRADEAQIIIVDCSGQINPRLFEKATIMRSWNYSHSEKIDHMIKEHITTRFVWLSDDDVMIVNSNWEDMFTKYWQSSEKEPAVISFQPRGWNITSGVKAMGCYSILFDKDIFIREKLSFKPVRSTNSLIGRSTGYYDTADFANQQLLEKGYSIYLCDQSGPERIVLGFTGTSMAFVELLKGREEFLRGLSNTESKIASYSLTGSFCVNKVAELYKYIFSIDPTWKPPLKQDEIISLSEKLLPEDKLKALSLFERFEHNFEELKRLA